MSNVDIIEEAKKGKMVIITSKTNVSKIALKNPSDAKKVAVVVVD